MKKGQIAAVLMGFAVFLVVTGAAAAASGFWSSSATAKGGENLATVNGKGGCQVTAVFVNGRQLRADEFSVESPGSSKPKIHFCFQLPKGTRVVVRGTTTNSGNSQRFSMKLSTSG